MERAFWSGKRVFVTGHTGFKGSWLAFWLEMLGAEVCGYALEPPTAPSLYELLALDGRIHSIRGDVREVEQLEAAMRAFLPEIVLHLAAQPLVRLSYQSPVETYAVNVMGTVNLLDAVRRLPGVRSVVIITSDKCYENQEWHWAYREQEPMGGHDPYSSSKGCAELITAAYRRSFFQNTSTAVATARAGNVIGGGDWAVDRLVPDIVRAFAAHETVSIRNPEAVRPWQHVLEPLNGYLLLAQRLYTEGAAFAEAWNFGPADGDARPVEHLVSELAHFWGDGAKWKCVPGEKLHEAHQLRLDSSKARARLHWSSRWNLTDSLLRTVQWYQTYYKGGDVRACTATQIEEYSNLRAPEAGR